MIFLETVRAAHETLGRPTDDATLQDATAAANEAVSERSDVHFTRLFDKWQADNPDAPLVPGEVIGQCHADSIRIAQEEILEEWYNEPIRALTDQKVAAGEDGW